MRAKSCCFIDHHCLLMMMAVGCGDDKLRHKGRKTAYCWVLLFGSNLDPCGYNGWYIMEFGMGKPCSKQVRV